MFLNLKRLKGLFKTDYILVDERSLGLKVFKYVLRNKRTAKNSSIENTSLILAINFHNKQMFINVLMSEIVRGSELGI